MTPDRWQQIKSILDRALETEAGERAAFVVTECNGDGELAAEVESYLAAASEVGDFIEEPVCDLHGDGLDQPILGERLGAYRVVSEIGRGGMGAVYLAERADAEFDKRVAIKLLKRGLDTDEIIRRFRGERQILAQLDHPNIAKLLDGGTTPDGRPFLVMEHVEGQPIDDYCAARDLPLRERLELFRTVCSAVHFAHQNLVVHRDLKPGNIVIGADGAPKLLDFGIAKLLSAEDSALTTVGLQLMTLAYASPEQVRGDAVTTASDVYSLGVLLYKLLAGKSPYGPPDMTRESLARAVCEREPEKPSTASGRRQLAGDLDNIVLMALRKDPLRRYASADQLAGDIGRYLKGLPVIARKDTLGYRTGKFVRRHKLSVSLAATLLLLILGASVTTFVLFRQADRERERAQRVLGLLKDVFTNPDPGKSRGESVTAREVLDRGRKEIFKGLEKEPEIKGDLMATMGQVYANLGVVGEARPLLEESLDLRRATLGNDSLQVADSLHNLASVLRETGDEPGAELLLREAVAIQRRHPVDDEYAKGLNNLAAFLESQEQYDEAELLFNESLDIKRRLFGNEHLDVARGLHNLGHLFQSKGDRARAEDLYRRELEMRQKLLGGRPHPEVATSLNTLATLLEDRGDVRGAEHLYRESLAMRRKLYSEPHQDLARSLNNLASLLQAQKDYRAAESLYREALTLYERLGYTRHPERAVVVRNLASVLVAQGNALSAEPLAREALGILQERKSTSWRVADFESVLGGCLAGQDRFQDAEPLLVRGYQELSGNPGAARYASQALTRLVELYEAWGKPDLAAEYRARQRS